MRVGLIMPPNECGNRWKSYEVRGGVPYHYGTDTPYIGGPQDSVDGHIFRKADIVEMMDELQLLQSRYNWGDTPNVLESQLQRFWPLRGNYMMSPKHSVVVNSPNNRVQDSHKNRSGDVFSYDSKYLLDKYVDGNRISLEDCSFDNIRCPHTEIDLIKGIK